MQTIIKGQDIEGFQLAEQIGIGSSGEVWSAANTQQHVAIKFLNKSLLERNDREVHLHRFRNEALALKTVSDLAHVPTYYQHNLEVERPYIIMSYISGNAVSDLIKNSEILYIPLPSRLYAINQLANTIQTIHNRGIIHRDIKPQNIHGIDTPYLLDFSVSIPISESHTIGENVGTPLYLTPNKRPPSIHTDNYAFAIMTYEILFGRHPIFDYLKVPKSVDALLQYTGHALENGTWHRPDQLNGVSLPVNLQGADLSAITTIFQNTFTFQDNRYEDLTVFVHDLIEAITDSNNLPYLNAIPTPTEEDISGISFGYVTRFTPHIVETYGKDTDLGLSNKPTEPAVMRQQLIGLAAIFVFLFLVLIILMNLPIS